MNISQRRLNNYLPLLPSLVSGIAYILNSPYFGIVESLASVIFVVIIIERFSRKQLLNVLVLETPNVLAAILEIQYLLLGQPMTRVIDPATSIIVSIYIYRCRHMRQSALQPKKMEPTAPLQINLTLHCPECGLELLADPEFCPKCGTKLPSRPR